jgi:hypothetical protein
MAMEGNMQLQKGGAEKKKKRKEFLMTKSFEEYKEHIKESYKKKKKK